jgi:hypothetical protein
MRRLSFASRKAIGLPSPRWGLHADGNTDNSDRNCSLKRYLERQDVGVLVLASTGLILKVAI